MFAQSRRNLEAIVSFEKHAQNGASAQLEGNGSFNLGGSRVSESNVNYESIDFADMQVRVYGNMALVTGKVAMSQSSNGKANTSNLVVLHVFSKGRKAGR